MDLTVVRGALNLCARELLHHAAMAETADAAHQPPARPATVNLCHTADLQAGGQGAIALCQIAGKFHALKTIQSTNIRVAQAEAKAVSIHSIWPLLLSRSREATRADFLSFLVASLDAQVPLILR